MSKVSRAERMADYKKEEEDRKKVRRMVKRCYNFNDEIKQDNDYIYFGEQ